MVVFTIHRYIFKDLIKIFLLSTVAMTIILSLGNIIRPIQKFGIGPEQVVSLLGYFIPITLTFVLPMAALFACAITYGRFASDNELDACRASGISTMTVIYPSLCLAIAVAIVNIVLSFYVVPNYIGRAERSIKANAKQIVFRSIERQGYFEAHKGKFKILADSALIDQNKLFGVDVIESKKGVPQSIVSCKSADVDFDTHTSYNDVTVIAHEAYQLDSHGQAYTKELPIKAKLPSFLEDDIKFQKIEQLKKIKSNPLLFDPIKEKAIKANSQLACDLLKQEIALKINEPEDHFFQMINDSRVILFTADDCTIENEKIKLLGNIELYEYDLKFHDELIRKWTSQQGFIKIQEEDLSPHLILVLENAKWTNNDGLTGVPTRHNIRNLKLPETLQINSTQQNLINNVNKISANVSLPSSFLIDNINQMNREIMVTFGSIHAEIHSRLVFGIGCISLILMGTALGIIHKGGHLLTAFGISSIPAAALIVFIMMGKNLTKNIVKTQGYMSFKGIFLMWLGLALLTFVCYKTYKKLLKT